MANSNAQTCLVGFSSFVRLFLLGVIIVLTMQYFTDQSLQIRLMIALAVCVFYGMSDLVLNWILSLTCPCAQHNNSKSSS